MKETKKNQNNNTHLYGYINGVRVNETGSGKTAVNLDVCTLETFKNDKGAFENKRTYHDVVMFTENKEIIEKFIAIGEAVEKNRQMKDEKNFKPETHTISLDGVLLNKKDSRDLQVFCKEDGFELDVKQADKEIRNKTEFVGNIASVQMHEDKNFAVVTVMNHFRPSEGEERETALIVRINGDRKFSKETYEALKKGEMGVGDFIRVGGQLHNNNFENEKGKFYGMALDLTSSELLHKKGEKKEEKAEVKKEPAKKAAAKKETKKAEQPKKAVSRKKKGVTVG